MIRTFIKRQLSKLTTTDLAMNGLTRQVQETIINNPGLRAYEIGRKTFGNPQDINCYDHKNMLTWACIAELQKRGEIIRSHQVQWSAVTQEQRDQLDYLMAEGEEDAWADLFDSLPKERYAVFYACSFV